VIPPITPPLLRKRVRTQQKAINKRQTERRSVLKRQLAHKAY